MKIIIGLLLAALSVFGFVNLNVPKIKSGDFKLLTTKEHKSFLKETNTVGIGKAKEL